MVKNQINYLIGNKHNSRPNTRKLKNQSKINGCEIIPEEDEDIKKADQMIKKISKKGYFLLKMAFFMPKNSQKLTILYV